MEKRIGEDSNQNKTFGKKVANVGKVGHNLCKKGCLQPLKKRLWQTACEKTNIWKTKGCAIYPLMAGICSQQPLEKMIYGTVFGKKTSSFKTGSQSQNLWQKGTCMLLQQVEPLKKRYGKASISQELLSRSSLAKFFCFQTSELAHSQPSKK